MKYPDDFINKIICGDCLKVMKHIPDGAVDLVLTDPPYGIGISGQKLSIGKNSKHDRKYHKDYDWDNDIPSKECFDKMIEMSSNQIIWGGNYFIKNLQESHKCWIYWHKGQDGLTMSDGELAYTSFDSPQRRVLFNRAEILKDGSCHPTQKPLALMRWCIEKYSDPNDLILDPFLGSGTTAVACKQLGRRYIGIEINPSYCKIAEDRLRQGELF